MSVPAAAVSPTGLSATTPPVTAASPAAYQQQPTHETYQGEWSDWFGHGPREPEPKRPAPNYFQDDEVFAPMIERSKTRPPMLRWVPLLGSLGAAALVAVAFTQVSAGPPPQSAAASVPAQITGSAPAPAAAQCPPERVGNRIQGNGAGGVDSGTAAIFAFQHAYYVSRSGEQAHAFVTPDAAVSPAADIQHGIDSIPEGTTHCLTVTPDAFAGQYLVVVTEYPAGASPITYNPQLVTTARNGNRILITAIAAAN